MWNEGVLSQLSKDWPLIFTLNNSHWGKTGTQGTDDLYSQDGGTDCLASGNITDHGESVA